MPIVCMCPLPALCFDKDRDCGSCFIFQTACMPCLQHHQECLSFLLNFSKSKKSQTQPEKDIIIAFIYDDPPRVIFWMLNRFADILADNLQAYHCCLRETLSVLSVCVELSVL